MRAVIALLVFAAVLLILPYRSYHQATKAPTPAVVIQQDHAAFEEKPAALPVTPVVPVETPKPRKCRRVTIDTAKDPYWAGVKGPLHAKRCDPIVKPRKRPKPAAHKIETPAAAVSTMCPIANLPCPWRGN